MAIQKINAQPSFSGKLSANTIKKFAEELGSEGYDAAKSFRAGKNKHDSINIIYDIYPAMDVYRGQIAMTDTYMEVSNVKSKKPPIRFLLSKGKMPIGQEMLDLISSKMKFLDKMKNKSKNK